MNKDQLRYLIRASLDEVWYRRSSVNPVNDQEKRLTEEIWELLTNGMNVMDLVYSEGGDSEIEKNALKYAEELHGKGNPKKENPEYDRVKSNSLRDFYNGAQWLKARMKKQKQSHSDEKMDYKKSFDEVRPRIREAEVRSVSDTSDQPI